MALYTIGDTHLSLAKDKPMDIFGEKWKNHAQKLKDGFSIVGDDDLTVICGDTRSRPEERKGIVEGQTWEKVLLIRKKEAKHRNYALWHGRTLQDTGRDLSSQSFHSSLE